MKVIIGRITALCIILTKRNFILLYNLIEPENNKDTRKSQLLRRTNFSEESDFLFLKMGLLANFNVVEIEDKHHKELGILTVKLNNNESSFVWSALNAYFIEANEKLKRNDLGIIERKNYEYQLEHSKRLMCVVDKDI